MASSDKESKRPPQIPDDQQEAQRTTERVRLELSKIAELHCGDNPADAFCLFLRVHSCIFDRVLASRLPHMVALNPLFARRFLNVCEDVFGNAGFATTTRLWFKALYFYYAKRPKHVPQTLALMAEAHILEDLPLSLIELERATGAQIDEEQYQVAFNDIAECLKELDDRLVKEAKSVWDWLISTLSLHFDAVRGIRSLRVSQLRRAAWDEYQRRRNLALAQTHRQQERPPEPLVPSS